MIAVITNVFDLFSWVAIFHSVTLKASPLAKAVSYGTQNLGIKSEML